MGTGIGTENRNRNLENLIHIVEFASLPFWFTKLYNTQGKALACYRYQIPSILQDLISYIKEAPVQEQLIE